MTIHIPFQTEDEEYLTIARNAFERWIGAFRPEIIFWIWGYDGTKGEYGDIGLTPHLLVRLAAEIETLALEFCKNRLIVVLCGGSRRDYAFYLIPRIINTLLA